MSALASQGQFVVEALGVVGLVLVVGLSFALVELCMLRQGRAAAIAAASFASAVTVCVLLRDALKWMQGRWGSRDGGSSSAYFACAHLPLALYVAALVCLAVVTIALVVRIRRIHASRITPDTVREALDGLPDGVCFSREDGSPMLTNARMDELVRDAFGVGLSDARDLWARIAKGRCEPGFAVEHADDAHAFLTCPDGAAWQLRCSELVVGQMPVVETIATCVTEEYGMASQLEERNARLAGVNERLRAYGRDVARLTREEEVLAAKVRVHDEMGRALVALSVYERQSPGERDRAGLLALWRRVTHLMEVAEEDERPTDEWQQLLDAAAAIDVRLQLEGLLPEPGPLRRLTVIVAHECLNNAVRHGDARTVRIRCGWVDGLWELRVSNDGACPAGPVVETGGLANLRQAVRNAGGEFEVAWSPEVAVTVRLGVSG